MAAPHQLDRGRLTGLEEWQCVEKHLSELIEKLRDMQEDSRNMEEFQFLRGQIKAFRAILVLPAELFMTEEERKAVQSKQMRPIRQVGTSWEEEEWLRRQRKEQ